jgi:hypothetical protein
VLTSNGSVKNERKKFRLPPSPLTSLAKKILVLFSRPHYAALFAIGGYSILAFSNDAFGGTSIFNYYSYLADAFLHGQFHLRLLPNTTHDLVYFQGKYFLYWPPFPAVMIMPLVLLFGIGFSDVTMTICLGAANVFLAAFLLKRLVETGFLSLSPLQRGILVFTFAFGTPFTTQTSLGHVWATGQLWTLFFVFLAYVSATSMKGWKAFLWTGVLMACALGSRNHLILNGLWLAYYLLLQHWQLPWRKKILYSAIALLPVVMMGSLLAIYNYTRFGNIADVGLDYHQMAELFVDEYKLYGAFNVFYLPRNLYYHWIAYPFLSPGGADFFMGGSLFLLTPLFFAVFWAFRIRKTRLHAILLALTCLAVYFPIAMLMGTGFVQFGSRYLMDFSAPLLILTALGMEHWRARISGYLAAIALIQFMAGIMILFLVAA